MLMKNNYSDLYNSNFSRKLDVLSLLLPSLLLIEKRTGLLQYHIEI